MDKLVISLSEYLIPKYLTRKDYGRIFIDELCNKRVFGELVSCKYANVDPTRRYRVSYAFEIYNKYEKEPVDLIVKKLIKLKLPVIYASNTQYASVLILAEENG